VSILGIVGPLGHGKTMNAVRVARDMAVERHAVLISNISINPPPGVLFEQLTIDEGWPDRLAILVYAVASGALHEADGRPYGGVVIVLDEAGLVLNAREWKSFPFALVWLLSQSRKFKAELVYTAQWSDMVDSVLRGMTDEIWTIRAFPRPTIGRRLKGKRPWLFHVRQWRPNHVEQKDACLGSSWFFYHRSYEGLYDTDCIVWPPKLAALFANLENSPVGFGAVPNVGAVVASGLVAEV
jgi:hypothetical protein